MICLQITSQLAQNYKPVEFAAERFCRKLWSNTRGYVSVWPQKNVNNLIRPNKELKEPNWPRKLKNTTQ